MAGCSQGSLHGGSWEGVQTEAMVAELRRRGYKVVPSARVKDCFSQAAVAFDTMYRLYYDEEAHKSYHRHMRHQMAMDLGVFLMRDAAVFTSRKEPCAGAYIHRAQVRVILPKKD